MIFFACKRVELRSKKRSELVIIEFLHKRITVFIVRVYSVSSVAYSISIIIAAIVIIPVVAHVVRVCLSFVRVVYLFFRVPDIFF